MEETEDTKMLPCALTEEERELRGRTLAQKIAEQARIEDEKKTSNAGFTAKLKALDEVIADLAESVNTGTEKRLVPVEERADNRRFAIDVVRMDTGAVIDTRAMNQEEIEQARQPSLFNDRRSGTDDGEGAEGGAPTIVHTAKDACPDCGQVGGHDVNCSALANVPETKVAPPAEPKPAQPAPDAVPVDLGGEECPKCGATENHLDGCPVAAEVLKARAEERKTVCKSCGIVGGDHRPDCTREEDAQAPAEGDVTDPAALLAAAAAADAHKGEDDKDGQ